MSDLQVKCVHNAVPSSCNECGPTFTKYEEFYVIQIAGKRILLCPACFEILKGYVNLPKEG